MANLRLHFANGYGASVIDHGYGASEGLLEVAVSHGDALCYSTPITGDVLGWLTMAEAKAVVAQIEALPVNTECSHERPGFFDDLADFEDAGPPALPRGSNG